MKNELHDNKASLLTQWKNRKATSDERVKISKAPQNAVIPLSNGQRRLWFLQQLYPKSPVYNYSEIYVFNGRLDAEILLSALEKVCEDHDILRSTYHMEDGELFIKIAPNPNIRVAKHDFSHLESHEAEASAKVVMTADARHSFSLSEHPIVLVSLVKINSTKHTVLLTLHHISTDKWSMGILRNELAKYYRAMSSGGASSESRGTNIQFSDYTYWQQNQPIDTAQLDYWKNKLSGEIPIINLPTDFPKPAVPTFEGGAGPRQYFSREHSTEILNLAKKMEVTPYVLFLSVYYMLLFRYCGQEDILIGTPIANRDQKALEEIIGFFNDTLVLRTKLSSGMQFKELVQQVRSTTLEAFSNKDVPFDTLVKELKQKRSQSVHPFFQVMFLYHSVPETPSFGSDVTLEHDFFDAGVSKFDLTLYISEEDGILSTTFEYTSDLFTETSIARIQAHFNLLMKGVVDNDACYLSEVPMFSDADKNLLRDQKSEQTAVFESYSGIHEIIANVCQTTPNKKALTFGDISITYGELEKRANSLAIKILEKTHGQNKIVGLLTERSLEMIVGLYAILKSGCAYLPLDVKYPKQRLAFMLNDADVTIVIMQEGLLSDFDDLNLETLSINHDKEVVKGISTEFPKANRNNLAYMIYTSGSTGQPKGVPISHGNIINSTAGRLSFYPINPQAFLLMSSISFDSSKAGIFWTLCTGGHLVLTEDRLEQDIEKLQEVIFKNKVSHILMLPSLYGLLIEYGEKARLQSLTTVIVAGEACSPKLCKMHFEVLPKVAIYNEYGPTEATVWCLAHKIELRDTLGAIPIGKPVAGAKIYLLDSQMNLVPFGAVGEIYVGGLGLAGEYLNRPDLTAKGFVDNPFSSTDKKLYKTGDLAKIDSVGNMLFLGRADHQVKIRGHRIELDEIKNVILNEQRITDAEVVVINSNGTDQLVLYILSQEKIDIQSVKKALNEKLPKYMIPSRYLVMHEFPKLPNGKVDMKALELLKPEEKTSADDTPQNTVLSPVQQKLVNIWQEVLKISLVTIHDNFFEIGGDSILSIQLITHARKLGLNFSPNELFEHQTIAELEISLLKSKENLPDENQNISGPVSLLPIQRWYFETHKNAPQFWNQAYALKVTENENHQSIKSAAEFVYQKHDGLRSLFKKEHVSWTAKIVDAASVSPFEFYDISNVDNHLKNEKIESTLADIQVGITLDKGPLFRCIYFEAGLAKHSRIILLAHHLVVDMVSWKLILDDFMSFRKSGTKGKMSQTTSILKWGNYLNDLANSNSILEETNFWKEQSIVSTSLPTDFQKPLPIIEKNVGTLIYTLDPTNTDLLTTKANVSYSTKTDELVMAAVAITFTKWTGIDTISFAMERHGRETLGANLDLSDTVGWFTAFFPLAFELPGSVDLGNDIIAVKEKMRNIPHGGIGYGILRYFTHHLGTIDYPEIVFNFLGKRDSGEFEFLASGVRHPESEKNYLIEINSFIDHGELVMYWSYSAEHYLDQTIEVLLKKFDTILKEIIIHCTEICGGKFTPSDFPELGLDQDDLDGLLDSLDL